MARATVLRGVTVGRNATVVRDSAVTHDVDEDSVLLAAPATPGGVRVGSRSVRHRRGRRTSSATQWPERVSPARVMGTGAVT